MFNPKLMEFLKSETEWQELTGQELPDKCPQFGWRRNRESSLVILHTILAK